MVEKMKDPLITVFPFYTSISASISAYSFGFHQWRIKKFSPSYEWNVAAQRPLPISTIKSGKF